jgi:hypothetical protein
MRKTDGDMDESSLYTYHSPLSSCYNPSYAEHSEHNQKFGLYSLQFLTETNTNFNVMTSSDVSWYSRNCKQIVSKECVG